MKRRVSKIRFVVYINEVEQPLDLRYSQTSVRPSVQPGATGWTRDPLRTSHSSRTRITRDGLLSLHSIGTRESWAHHMWSMRLIQAAILASLMMAGATDQKLFSVQRKQCFEKLVQCFQRKQCARPSNASVLVNRAPRATRPSALTANGCEPTKQCLLVA